MEMEAICEEAGDGLRRSASIAGLGWGVVGWWVVGGGGWWVVGVWVGGLGGGGGEGVLVIGGGFYSPEKKQCRVAWPR